MCHGSVINVNRCADNQGPRIPHSETVNQKETRAFLLLLLFKPWRQASDLQYSNEQDWAKTLEAFESECGETYNVQ